MFRYAKVALVGLMIVALSTIGFPAVAQPQSAAAERQMTLARIQADSRTVMFTAMDLDDQQVDAFAPIYDAFQAEHKKIMDRAVALISSFASNYESMTDETAEGLLGEWLRLEDDEGRLIRQYSRKLGRVLPATKVLRFVQIQNKLTTVLRLEAVQHLPLAE